MWNLLNKAMIIVKRNFGKVERRDFMPLSKH